MVVVDYLLDTNIVSYILKKRNLGVNRKLEEVRRLGKKVFVSCITYYEINRGLLALNATRQLADFNSLFRIYPILYLDIEIIETACRIHANLKNKGRAIQDADVLIAATAITRGLILVSNDSDMARIEEIYLENWVAQN
ncbi:MAG: type II toxin-antitoxin system VapC family toxin [Richelia sp. SL_2_1]|nr:type II toxin-antitoxin system VapC family toxin [Richelia sp. SM1_7_0]NJO27887.1 type II toxin-antitoxin system VapC family toxin [Richelia sp. SL_2_1]